VEHRRNAAPEIEHELARNPELGYEPVGPGGVVRCIEHGSPTPLERWHCHDEYELQLIVGARGRAFVGDHVGHFEPGHLVLAGPRLPHNWISTDLPPGGLALRSLVLQFHDQPLRDGMKAFRELEELAPLLERARHGVEFFGLGGLVRERFHRIKASRGLERFSEFAGLLGVLARWPDYRLLSAVQLAGFDGDSALGVLNKVVDYVNAHYMDELSLAVASGVAGMSESRFSRCFSKTTGSTFSEFVTRLRVNKACELLMRQDLLVSNACYQAGFNNLANFNRRFLELKGVTPTEFRRQAAQRFGRSGAA
jgi:AraC-like DNA-binding protein